MADKSGIFGKGSVAEQMFVYGILQNVIGSLLQPLFTGLQQNAYSNTPNMALSAAVAADLVTRGHLTRDAGADIAKKNGIDGAGFDQLISVTESAPNLSILVAAYQRGYLGLGDDSTANLSFLGGLKQNGIDPRWADIITKSIVDWPSRQEVMNALLEGQITEPVAMDWYLKAGGNPDWFQNDFNANGSAPSPVELGVMMNRGIIPAGGSGPEVVSFEQGFLEGPWRNKWLGPMQKLAHYVPPPRTITALIHEGVVDDATALKWFQGFGMDAATAAVYLKSAHSGKTSAAKALTVSNIETLYKDKLITAAEATSQLVALGYPQTAAAELIKLADFNVAHANITSAVTRIKTLYVQRKITKANATDALTKLGQAAADVASVLQVWDVEISVNVKQLTEAQIVQAYGYAIMTQSEAMGNLQAIGYTPYDAWVLLSIKNKAPLDGAPAKGPAPIGVLP